MLNNRFDIASLAYARKTLQRSKADGISLFLYDKRDGGDILFLHQQNTLPEAMQAYRQRLHKYDSFLQQIPSTGVEQNGFSVKLRERPSRPSGAEHRGDSVYWKGLGGFGYQETASMVHSLSSNLHLVIGLQMMTQRRHMNVESAIACMEEWMLFGRDFILDQSLEALRRDKHESAGDGLQAALACATKREQQVICEILQGHSNKEIADKLSLSYFTVENHLRRIYKKFGVHSRTALVAALRS